MTDQQLQTIFQKIEKAVNDLSGQVAGITAVLEDMDGLPKAKKEQIKQKLAGIVPQPFAQGNPRAVAETTVERILKG